MCENRKSSRFVIKLSCQEKFILSEWCDDPLYQTVFNKNNYKSFDISLQWIKCKEGSRRTSQPKLCIVAGRLYKVCWDTLKWDKGFTLLFIILHLQFTTKIFFFQMKSSCCRSISAVSSLWGKRFQMVALFSSIPQTLTQTKIKLYCFEFV